MATKKKAAPKAKKIEIKPTPAEEAKAAPTGIKLVGANVACAKAFPLQGAKKNK